MQIIYSRRFKKEYKKCPEEIKILFARKLKTLLENPDYPLLNNHPLTGELLGYRSVNVTGDWRLIFQSNNESIILEAIGTHSQLYK